MVDHPCAEGLSAACFKAYPKWARQALAYKLLHIILPKQLTRKLPVTSRPLPFFWNPEWEGWFIFDFDPDAPPWELDWSDWTPGDPLPPGLTINPNVVFPPGWTPGDPLPPGVIVPPGTFFPSNWKPWDPLPPGVTIDPPAVLPPGWTPPPAPPPAYHPGPGELPISPGHGAIPPIFIPPFGPGPIGGPHTTPPVEFDVGDLLATLNTHALSLQLGYGFVYFDRGLAIETSLNAKIHAIDAMVGRVSNPVNSVNLQIWTADASYKPVSLVSNGTSENILGSTLPVYDTFQDYVRFYFYGKPILVGGNKYAIVAHRTGDNSTAMYYRVGTAFDGTKYTYARLLDTSWWATVQRKMIYKIWGKLV